MVGVVLILIVMFLVGPVAVFVAGAIWSALFGWVVGDSVAPADTVPDANATS